MITILPFASGIFLAFSIFIGIFAFGVDMKGKLYFIRNEVLATRIFGFGLFCSAALWTLFATYVAIKFYLWLTEINFFM